MGMMAWSPPTRLAAQAAAAVVMIRPHRFAPDPQTPPANRFHAAAVTDTARGAYREITNAARLLREAGVTVHLFEDEDGDRPDAAFPHNWFSTHAGGHVAVYPMKAAHRRIERRTDIIEMLKSEYRVQDVTDYSQFERDGLFLDGTGAMVLDHIGRVAYAVGSDRTHPVLLERFCTRFGYEPMLFDAHDAAGAPVHHTNVLMCVGTDVALVGLDLIRDDDRRDAIVMRLESSGRRVIALSPAQVARFAGNAIELRGRAGHVMALSTTAARALAPDQIAMLCDHVTLLPIDMRSIEQAGGSIRCAIAEIHLSPRLGRTAASEILERVSA